MAEALKSEQGKNHRQLSGGFFFTPAGTGAVDKYFPIVAKYL
jgi:hypothetical protein